MIKLKEIIDKGTLGKITSIIARRVGIFPPQIKDANVLIDLGVHDIDIINYLIGAKPDKVFSNGGKAILDNREDYAEIFLNYGEASGFIQVNWITPVKIRNLAVTAAGLNQYGLDWAMGYGVPDSGSRDYSKQGFAVQVDWGAWQLKWNMVQANDPALRANVAPYYTGNTINIDGVNTPLENGSTASLYRYNPHFHGNQNLRNILNSWFEPTPVAWNASRIIEDSFLSNSASMNQQQIQDFLVAKGSYLANYTVSGNAVVGADSYRCPVPTLTYVYRFWNNNGTHFYTASEAEKANIIAKYGSLYRYEGVAYTLNQVPQNNLPLYRFYNKQNNTHFYTASEAEKSNILQRWGYIYQLEGVSYYVSSASGGSPVYRFWNNNGTHFYTASEAEKNNVISKYSSTYKYEGVAYFIY